MNDLTNPDTWTDGMWYLVVGLCIALLATAAIKGFFLKEKSRS